MRLIFQLLIAAAIIIRIFLIRGMEAALPASVGVICIILLIRNAQWLADNVLPLGWMSYYAKDFRQSGKSGPALEFLGWLVLLLILATVFILQ